MPDNKTLLDVIGLADELHETQLAYLNDSTVENAEELRRATHAYGQARSTLVIDKSGAVYSGKSLDEVTDAVLSRISGMDIYRPVTTQEARLVRAAIEVAYEELTRRG